MNSTAILRSVLIYAICVPLAIFLGYLLSDPLSYNVFYAIGAVLLVLVSPLMLKWHYPLLLISWNMTTCFIIFLKGSPSIWLVMVVISLLISILERALSRESNFIHVRQMTFPLLALVAVVVFTAKMTGGFGLRSFGSDVYGGRKYIFLIVGILSYFALTARRIPPEKARRYAGLFFVGGFFYVIGDFYTVAPSSLHFIFWFFPPSSLPSEWQLGTTRLGGFATAALSVFYFMLVRYGVRGIFFAGKPWRIVVLMSAFMLEFLGGFRSAVFGSMFLFLIQSYLEGVHKTKLLPTFALLGCLILALLVPFASKLPFTFQRTLAFLPLELDAGARMDAEGSTNWRLDMWNALLPQVPRYLLVGKGYAISQEDFQMMGFDSAFSTVDSSQQPLSLSGDYHNGPLSVLIPFGLWGALAFLWFLGASLWVVVCNYKYGDPTLRSLNAFFLALVIKQIVVFFFVFGALSSDVGMLVGSVGLSISINGGVYRRSAAAQPAPEPESAPDLLPRPRPSYQR